MIHSLYEAAKAEEQGDRQEWGQLQWLANNAIGNTTGLTLGRVTIKAGQSNPRHRHNSCEEVLYLLAGELEHTVGDQTVSVRAGDTLAIPAGMFHNASNTGEQDADMIVAYSSAHRDFELEKQADRQ